MKKTNMILSSIIAVFMVLSVISGCEQQIINGNGKYGPGTYQEVSFDLGKEVKTKTFTSEKELDAFLKNVQTSSGNYYGGGGMMMKSASAPTAVREEMIALDSSVGSSGEGSVSALPNDHSQTNNQVESVDEADIIKTDGDYIYTVSNNVLFIVKAYPGEDAKVVSKLKFESMNPESIFLSGNHLAVFGNFYDNDYFKKINYFPRSGMSFFNVYDISDKENPKLVKEYKFDGNFFRGRMYGDYVYLITNTYPRYNVYPMPLMYSGTEKIAMPIDHIYYYDMPYSNPTFVNIHAINLNDLSEEVESKSIAVDSTENMYMSEKNLYIASTDYINEYEIQRKIAIDLLEPMLTDSDKVLIEKIKQTDDDVLSKYEKDQKIYQIIESYSQMLTQDEQQDLSDKADKKMREEMKKYKYMEYTVINKISIDGNKIEPVANGKIPGRINNQFSMDEKDDVLRIATTVSQRWSSYFTETSAGSVSGSTGVAQVVEASPDIVSEKAVATSAKLAVNSVSPDVRIMPPIRNGFQESMNNVYTLDSNLEIMDSIEGLAEGEQIFSTRFMGDRLYMVTFRQVDPFFVVDLSDPTDIEVLGKLKIPGFSRYLHPYDKDTIIGIGQDASDSGRAKGFKVSLFDVSDVENPKEIAKYVSDSDYASSTALWEHRAFLFSKDKELMVIPIYNYDYQDPTENYNGALVFKVTKDEIKLRGLIDHSQGTNTQYYWSPMVERSLYIEDLLYTKSPGLLRINKIDTLDKVKNVDLDYSDIPIKVY